MLPSASEVAEQSRTAARILGVTDLVLGDFPDQGVDTVPLNDVVKRISTLITETQPEVIYTRFGDLNRDHRVLAQRRCLLRRGRTLRREFGKS